jgi:hypothetical protein
MRTRIVRTRAAAAIDLTAPTPPAAQSLASSATTASVTFTHPGAPAGVTYALTVTDEDDTAVTPDSGSGLGAWVFPVASGKAYKARLRATGTDGQVADASVLVDVQPDLATDFPVEGNNGWRRVFVSTLTTETPQGPLAAGAGTVSIGGATVPYLANATTGTFGVNNTTSITETDGLKMELTTTSGQLPQIALDIPLGETVTRENAIRVLVKFSAYNGDSSDSMFVFLSDPSIDPDNNENSNARTGGIRIMGTFANLYARRGGAASTAQAVATEWVNGSVPLYLTLIVPAYGNDVVPLISDASFDVADIDYRGRSNSRASSPEWDTSGSTFFIGDSWESVKVLFAVANGSAGSTLPYLAIEAIAVDVR